MNTLKKYACFIALLPFLLLGSCKSTKTITEVNQGETLVARDTIVKTHTDTIRIVKNYTDTLRTHDSIYVRVLQRNDTVFVEKYKEKIAFQGVSKIDTLWKVKTDTFLQTKTDTLRIWKFLDNDKVVEKKVYPWRLIAAMGAIIVLLSAYIIKTWHK